MKRGGKRLAAAGLALLAGFSGRARAAFDDLGAGARAPGMGNAFTAVADDVYSVSYNPAGLATLQRPEMGATYSKLFIGLTDGSDLGLSNIALAQPLKGGRNGVMGFSWQNFSLSGVYAERTLGVSYGRLLRQRPGGGSLYGGLTLKNLNRSFQSLPEASNSNEATPDSLAPIFTGRPDPLLTAKNSVSAWGADVGLLYRMRRKFSLGLAIINVNGPDVAFGSEPDKVQPSTRLGLGYKSLWMNLAGEVRTQTGPTGDKDMDFILAAERYFPTFDFGRFGLRAAIANGSRNFRQISAGASYGVNKIQFDYAFTLPLGGIQGTGGTHRIGLSLKFGARTPEEEYSAALVSQMQRAEARADAGLGYEYDEQARPATLDRTGLEDVKNLIEAGRYMEAHMALTELMIKNPRDPGLFHLARRLDTVVSVYPEFTHVQTKAEQTTVRSIKTFLAGKDRDAALLAAYAYSLDRDQPGIKRFLARIEDVTQLKAKVAARDRNLWEETHARAQQDFQAEDFVAAAQECREALVMEPEDVQGWKRLGTNYYLLGQYADARDAWTKALGLETDPNEKKSLETYLAKAEKAQNGVPPAEAPKAARKAAPAAPAPPPPSTSGPDPREIERLYQVGLEYYARGDSVMAAGTFQRILEMDPDNVPAQKALARIRRGTP